ncbi:MAG TPA: hypothetical protein VF190_15345 [Rhodothermales bacterium]
MSTSTFSESQSRTITKTTGISIALVISFMGLAFSAGIQYNKMAELEEKDGKIEQAIERLTELTAKHDRKIDLLEYRLGVTQ